MTRFRLFKGSVSFLTIFDYQFHRSIIKKKFKTKDYELLRFVQ